MRGRQGAKQAAADSQFVRLRGVFADLKAGQCFPGGGEIDEAVGNGHMLSAVELRAQPFACAQHIAPPIRRLKTATLFEE